MSGASFPVVLPIGYLAGYLPGKPMNYKIGVACETLANVYVGQKECSSSKSNKPVAMRICSLDDLSNDLLQQIKKEILILRSMKHSNIINLYDSFVHENQLYLTFSLLEYGSVTDIMHKQYIFGLPELIAAQLLQDALMALVYLHSRSITHNAIRCSHILVPASGPARLTGFRYAQPLIEDGLRKKVLHGLPTNSKINLLWLAPEMLLQNLHGYDCKADVYSIGISACEMANGFPPFSDMEHMQMLYEKMRGTQPRLLDRTTMPAPTDQEIAEDMHCEQSRRTFSQQFHLFVEACLQSDPANRLTAAEAVLHPFFKQLRPSKSKKKNQSYRSLLQPLIPSLVVCADKAGPSKQSASSQPKTPTIARTESTTFSDWSFC